MNILCICTLIKKTLIKKEKKICYDVNIRSV